MVTVGLIVYEIQLFKVGQKREPFNEKLVQKKKWLQEKVKREIRCTIFYH